jgi:hypothetical protein
MNQNIQILPPSNRSIPSIISGTNSNSLSQSRGGQAGGTTDSNRLEKQNPTELSDIVDDFPKEGSNFLQHVPTR